MDPSSIPSGWPPTTEGSSPRVVPLFPLPQVWLFPSVVMPLHVFERRYRQMIEDSLDGPGRIVMGTVLPGHEGELPGSPPVHSIAGLGEIVRHERLPDGRFHVWLFGLDRVRIREVDSDRLYRKAQIEQAEEISVPVNEIEELRSSLVDAIMARTDFQNVPDGVSFSQLVDFLLLAIPLPHDVLQRLYCELDLAGRARGVLEEHASRPITKLKRGKPPGFPGFEPQEE